MCDQTTTAHSPPCLISTLSLGTHAESSQGTPPTTSQESSCLLAPHVLSWDRAESARLREVVAGDGERTGVRLCRSEAGWPLGVDR